MKICRFTPCSNGCKTDRTLGRDCRLSVFENRVVSGIFRLKRVEVTGSWRKLHSY